MWKGKNRRGKDVTLLNPSEKGRKFACELKSGIKCTNEGVPKTNKDGSLIALNREEAAYRAGYLDARKDAVNAWKSHRRKQAEPTTAVVVYEAPEPKKRRKK